MKDFLQSTTNSTLPRVSVVIPTHNPRMDYLRRVLEALRQQTLAKDLWELVIIDNGSREALAGVRGQQSGDSKGNDSREEAQKGGSMEYAVHSTGRGDLKLTNLKHNTPELELGWHANARVVREERLGLTAARLRGFAETTGELIVLVDDDNVLDPDYLMQTVKIAEEFPFLGSWSGQAVFEFEDSSAQPPEMLRGLLLERHLDRDCWSNDRHHTKSDPYGAGMCVRRVVAEAYARKLASEPKRMELDLSGGELLYGGDLDLAFAGLDIGLGKGAFHRLKFTHLIPKSRCSMAYLMRAAEGHAYSEVVAAWLNGDRPPSRDATIAAKTLRWLRGLKHGRVYREFWKARHRGIAKAERKLDEARGAGQEARG